MTRHWNVLSIKWPQLKFLFFLSLWLGAQDKPVSIDEDYLERVQFERAQEQKKAAWRNQHTAQRLQRPRHISDDGRYALFEERFVDKGYQEVQFILFDMLVRERYTIKLSSFSERATVLAALQKKYNFVQSEFFSQEIRQFQQFYTETGRQFSVKFIQKPALVYEFLFDIEAREEGKWLRMQRYLLGPGVVEEPHLARVYFVHEDWGYWLEVHYEQKGVITTEIFPWDLKYHNQYLNNTDKKERVLWTHYKLKGSDVDTLDREKIWESTRLINGKLKTL